MNVSYKTKHAFLVNNIVKTKFWFDEYDGKFCKMRLKSLNKLKNK